MEDFEQRDEEAEEGELKSKIHVSRTLRGNSAATLLVRLMVLMVSRDWQEISVLECTLGSLYIGAGNKHC